MNALGIKILAAVLLAAIAVAGFNLYIGRIQSKADAAGYERAQSEYRARENKALKDAIDERDRLAKELEGVSRDARLQTEALEGAQRAAADAGQRLRNAELAIRRRAACAAGAAAGSATADATGDLLADVRRRLDEAEDATARFADQAHIAGRACERSADAVDGAPYKESNP